ncbi:ABC transporter ATP-binding protein [Puniceibacterium sp. HSS470]|jgi:branched-chain amino acid transport system ATP-binding protein|nr:ABC transporter ATP-binding protein [Puniceibacterium sp. HSS470]|tara:strand:+ start:39685 stop:40398 length:714 start_codon:yes stop_codon:yes gene_type:complete
MKASSLSVSGLRAGYGPTVVLEDIGFEIAPGSCAAILGRNGMGKTTLMASLMGLTRHHAGAITLDGADITRMPTWQRAHLGMAYVPQKRDIFPTLTVEENLFVGLKDRPRSALDEAYALFPRLAERRRNMGGQLSGGEQQMLATARSLLGQPSILLLDEPLEGLAPVICQELMSGLSQLKAEGHMTILLVEQRVASALEFSDQVIVLERGMLAWQGHVAEWRAHPALTDRYLGVAEA